MQTRGSIRAYLFKFNTRSEPIKQRTSHNFINKRASRKAASFDLKWSSEMLGGAATPVLADFASRRASPAPPGCTARQQGEHAKDAAAVPDADVEAGKGVVLEEEEEDDDDVPAVDAADEETQVDDLA